MQDTHHTYESLHQEHHAWRKYLIEERATLTNLSSTIELHRSINERAEVQIICNELEARRSLLLTEADNKLKSLTETDALMSKTNEQHHVVSQELFLINSRMRAGLLEFDTGCGRLQKDIATLS